MRVIKLMLWGVCLFFVVYGALFAAVAYRAYTSLEQTITPTRHRTGFG